MNNRVPAAMRSREYSCMHFFHKNALNLQFLMKFAVEWQNLCNIFQVVEFIGVRGYNRGMNERVCVTNAYSEVQIL